MQGFEFFSWPPRTELAPFVESIWGVRGRGSYTTEAVLPNGAVELMINFGPVQRVVGHGDDVRSDSYRHAWLSGMQSRRQVHESRDGVDHIAVCFRPGGAHAFFDLPLCEATDRVLELDTLIGKQATSLRDRLATIDGDRNRAIALERWLLGRRSVHAGFRTVRRATDLLRDGGAFRTSIADVCDQLGLSNKHLVDQFRRIVGLPPKVVGRIERFQAVIDACRGRSRVDWLEISQSFGYADQSHMIREFRRLGSVTPSEFLVQRSPDESHVALG